MDTRNSALMDSHLWSSAVQHKQPQKMAQEGNEGTSTSPYLYFSMGQSSEQLRGKTTTATARLFSAYTAMRSFWCQAHTVTDDGKSGCEEKLSGFDRLSERHFKGEENVQIIERPISLMQFKIAIIHLMPKRRKKKKKTQRTTTKKLWFVILLSSLQIL